MVLSSLLLLCLFQPPTTDGEPEHEQAEEALPAESDEERRAAYDAAQTALRAAEQFGDQDLGPESCVRLEQALRDVEQYTDLLMEDEDGRETWLYARLTLIRNYYGLGNDPARADELLEDTLRTVTIPKYIL
ncbi:MAG: hypothetical protein KC457_29770, partial [Myxococcales bacterium]|nr:hypothetical protein [Myxococcales bacterium]